MNDHSPDPRLRDAITDAVADVEPVDRLAEIRRRTARPSRRPWYVAGGASVLAAAAAVTAVAILGQGDAPRAADPADRTDPTGVAPSDPPTSPATTPPPGEGPPAGAAVPVYYVGPGPDGPDAPDAVLYRYFEHGTSQVPVLDLLTRTPSDPDYRTLWAAGSFVSLADPEAGVVNVFVNPGVRQRPDGMTEGEAELAVQQVVYSLRATFQAPDLAVQFRTTDNPIDQVFGVPTSAPLVAAPPLDVLSHMSISDPAEGATYSGSFTASGVANSFEASVYCQLLGDDGEPVWGEPTTARGWQQPRLFPWELDVDLSGVPAGTYTFVCNTDDPTGGTDGFGMATDTRSIVVE